MESSSFPDLENKMQLMKKKISLPSVCLSKPLADVARFFEPSLNSLSELRRVSGVYATFDIDVAL